LAAVFYSGLYDNEGIIPPSREEIYLRLASGAPNKSRAPKTGEREAAKGNRI
jgi:hypothetical protein